MLVLYKASTTVYNKHCISTISYYTISIYKYYIFIYLSKDCSWFWIFWLNMCWTKTDASFDWVFPTSWAQSGRRSNWSRDLWAQRSDPTPGRRRRRVVDSWLNISVKIMGNHLYMMNIKWWINGLVFLGNRVCIYIYIYGDNMVI